MKDLPYIVLVFFFFFSIGKTCLSQEYYLKQVYNFSELSSTFKSMDISNDKNGLIYFSAIQNVISGFESNNILMALDNNGTLLDSSRLAIDSVFLFNEGLFHLNDSIIILIGTSSDNRTDYRNGLFTAHYNKKRQTYEVYRETRSYAMIMRRVIPTRDGGFAGIGSSTRNGYSQIALYKYDSLGMFTHMEVYGAPGWQDAFSIVELADGGYVLGGWRKRGIELFQDHYIIRVDSSLNVVWERVIQGQYLGSGVAFIDVYDDGNIVCTSNRTREASLAVDPYAFEVNGTTGAIVWEKWFPQEYGSQFYKDPIIDKENNIIVPGMRRVWSDVENRLVFHLSLTKIKRGGELIWDRVYYFDHDVSHLFSVNPELDSSGFIWIAGRAGIHPLLMKVDSLGCPYPDCDDVEVSIMDHDLGVGFEVMPNPFTEFLQVKYQNTGGNKHLELRIMDIKGNHIFHTHINNTAPQGDVFLDTSRWMFGMYLVQIWVDGRPIRTEKVVKQ